MKRLALSAFLLIAGSSYAQELGDQAALRRALAVDPFAVTSYRILAGRLTAATRQKLVAELSASPRFADQIVAARLQIDAGQAALARARLHQSVAQLPPDARTLDAYAQLALSAGAYAEASTAAQTALRTGRTAPRLIEAAIAELRQGHHKEGLALLSEVRSKDAAGVASEAALDALLGQRMVAEAAELLRAQLETRPGQTVVGSVTQWRQLADLERQLGHADAANEAMLKALDVEPSATGRRSIAQSLLHASRDKKTMVALEKSLQSAKTAPRLVLRGDTQLALGKPAQAIESYTSAAKADPNDPEPELRLAATAKTPTERAARYATLVAAHPNDLRYALELADLRFAAKDDAGGRKALRDAAGNLSTAPSAQDQLARRLADHGDAAGALQCRKRAAQLDPRNADFAFSLADAYRVSGDRAAAVTAYDDAFARTDGGRASWDRIIDAYERAGYTAEADARYVAAQKKWPGDIALMRRHAAALERAKQFARAIAIWEVLGKDAQRPFDREQATYNIGRLKTRQISEQ
ncbi:MAG: hypothetical protein ABI321_04305 [Polyangia bacterium]